MRDGGGGGTIGDGSVTQLSRQNNTMTCFIPGEEKMLFVLVATAKESH